MKDITALIIALFLGAIPGLQNDLPSAVCLTVKEEWKVSKQESGGKTLTPAQLGAFLNRVAWKHRGDGFGVNKKNFGNFCPSPAGPVACDIIQRNDVLWDIVTSAGDPGEGPTCGNGEVIDRSDPYWKNRPFVSPVNPGAEPKPEPKPEPPPCDWPDQRGEVANLRKEFASLEGHYKEAMDKIQELQQDLTTAVRERDDARRELDELKNAPEPRCRFDWGKFTCRLVR